MNAHTTAAFAALLALSTFAAPQTAPKAKVDVEKLAQERIAKAGGYVYEPGVGKGFIAIVNGQDKVPVQTLVDVLLKLGEQRPYAVKVVKTAEEAKGATVTIRLIDDAAKSVFIAAPEESWAEINVGRLADDLKSDISKKKFLPQRARKEMLRALAYAAGAGGSGFAGNLLDTVTIRDLDYVDEFLPVDTIERLTKHLEKRGLEPQRRVPYRYACEEGWAPAPTNDIQKAIFEEIKNPEKRWDKDFGGQKK